MLAEDVMRMLPGKRLAIPQRLATLAMIHQSAFASPGGGEAALTGYPPLRVGDQCLSSRPRPALESGCGRNVRYRSGRRHLGRSPADRRPAPGSPHGCQGSDTTGLVTHDPDRFDLAAANGGKQLHGGQPGVCASRSVPKRASRCRSSGTKSMCAASIVASPPTSRPPMALG